MYRQTWGISVKNQTLSSELHGEALLAAKCSERQPLIGHLRDVTHAKTTVAAFVEDWIVKALSGLDFPVLACTRSGTLRHRR